MAQWLGEQRWGWNALGKYQARMCVVGVDGAALYYLDEDDLLQDVQVQSLHCCSICNWSVRHATSCALGLCRDTLALQSNASTI